MFQGGGCKFHSPILVCWCLFCIFYFSIYLREEAVDFTHPFLHIGLGVLGYKGAAPRSLQQLADDDSVKVILFLIIIMAHHVIKF